MSTWLNRGASGGLAGALKTLKKSPRANQSTASNTKILTAPDAENLFRYCAWSNLIRVDLRRPLALNHPVVLLS